MPMAFSVINTDAVRTVYLCVGLCLQTSDRSLVWNTDLIETMELENLLINAAVTMHSAERRKVRIQARRHVAAVSTLSRDFAFATDAQLLRV